MCSLDDAIKPLNTEPTKVVFRIQCNPAIDVITESVVYSILAQEGLAPQLYGIFSGGRIEEYIEVEKWAAWF